MKFSEFEYKHYDEDYLREQYCKYIAELKQANSSDEFMKVFYELNEFRGHIMTSQAICVIRHSINSVDKYYDSENDYWDMTLPKLEEYEVGISDIVLNCPFRDKLDIPETYIKLLENQKKQFSMDIIEDLQEENRLTSEYGKLKASAKIEFEGQVYNLASIEVFSTNHDREIRRRACKAAEKFYEDNERSFDDIYDKLVKVRDKIAKKLGYENFVELGYIRMNRLDYDMEKVCNFRKQVIKDIVPITTKIAKKHAARLGLPSIKMYDLGYKFKSGSPKPHGDIDELVVAASKMYSEMSQETKDFFKTMVDQELFDLPTRPNKQMGGYCLDVYDYRVPFIFANSNGTSSDVDTLTHEAGHAFQAYMTLKNTVIPDMSFATMETCEINSMSMEFFAHPWSELFFKEESDKYRYDHICSCMDLLPYGCLVDHFQHEVYSHPEYTPDQRKKVWRDLEKEYVPNRDYEDFPLLEKGGFFYRQGHIFESPFYYIDYSLAQICALQFFVRSLDNFEDAWNDYVKISSVGGTKSFIEQLNMANIKVPFEDGCLSEVARKIDEILDSVDDKQL